MENLLLRLTGQKTDIDDEMRGDGFIFWWGIIARFLVPRSAATMRTHGTETALGGFATPGFWYQDTQGFGTTLTRNQPRNHHTLLFLSLSPSLPFVFRKSCRTSVLSLLSTSPWLLLSKLPPLALIKSREMARPTGSGYFFLILYSIRMNFADRELYF